MKNLTIPLLLLISFVLLVAFLTVLFRPIYVPSVHPYASVTTVKIYDDIIDDEHFLGEVSMAPIAEELANARWKSTQPDAAAKIIFVAEGLRPMRMSYYGRFYTLEGVKGHFIPPFQSKDVVAAFLQRVRTDFLKR